MTVHFICRGNIFRSLIAETYLKSLAVPGLSVISSGTIADESRAMNKELGYTENARILLTRHGLAAFMKPTAEQLNQERISDDQVVICANQIAYEEAKNIVTLPDDTMVWDITDIGEGDRIATTDVERQAFEEEVFTEITTKVDELAKQL